MIQKQEPRLITTGGKITLQQWVDTATELASSNEFKKSEAEEGQVPILIPTFQKPNDESIKP